MHFGIVTPPVPGHLHPFGALGRELIARGHRVTCFQVEDLRQRLEAEGLGFHAIGAQSHPAGSLPASLAALGRLRGLAALRFTIAAVADTSEMVCRELPAALRSAGVQALLVDQMEPAGGAVAQHLGLPFVTVCNALAINRDPVVPPPFTPWAFRDAAWVGWRNRLGYAVSDRLTAPIARVVGAHRARWGLPALATPDDSFSPLAQICQMSSAFDFPRQSLPPSFRYVGPLRHPQPSPVPFPWERLDGRPLVFASLGTLQNSREPVFRCFAEACRGLDVQLVITHGGGLTAAQAAGLPGQPLVVPYAPQQQVLQRAALTLTHAGLNTVLDSLAAGVPMVAMPITYEQPAIARRVEHCGAGLSLTLPRLTPDRLRERITTVLREPSFREAAARQQRAIAAAGGVRRAADLVESALGAAPAGAARAPVVAEAELERTA
jgi:zeaxanthin glucosyltransferase